MSRGTSGRVTRKPFGPAVGVLLIAALLIHCGGGGQGPQITPPTKKGAPPPTPTMLRVLHRVLYGGTDRMTCCGSLDSNSYPSEGDMYYVADQPGSNRDPLNRYVNAGAPEHADGMRPLDNYTLEEVLGYPWTQASPGLTLLSEGFDLRTGDYALMLPSESLPGYSASSLGVYGYPRFAKNSEVVLNLSGGGVTVESNAVAGGVIWRWDWNGMQFENHFG